MTTLRYFGFIAWLLCMIGPQSFASVQTVPKVDLNRYVGTWYDIASNPILFQPSCPCERQVLTPEPSHKVSVFNSCNKKTASGPLSTIHGTAQAVDSTDAKLAVDFGLPWKGDYWIIGLDPDYRYAVVSDRFGYSLYILSKTPELDKSLYEAALEAAQKANVSTKRLVFSDQLGCQYPPTDAGLGE